MPSQVDKSAVGANFISEYYFIFCTRPRDLARLYTANADLRHGEGREGIGKGKDAVNLLCTKYPGENRGKVVVNEMEILPSNQRIVNVRVRGTFTTTATQAVQGFTQVFELHQHGDSNYFGITNDVMSWHAVETTTQVRAPVQDSRVPPPPTLAADDWANETPPLFAKAADPKAEISPMEQPLTAAAQAPAATLDSKAPAKEAPKAKHVDAAETKPAAEEPRKRTAAEVARENKKAAEDKKPKEEPKQAEPKKEEPKKQEEAPAKTEEKKEEPKAETKAEEPKEEVPDVDLSKMSMLERIRYKQNIKEKPIEEKKPEPKKEEKKEKTAEEKKREGDRRREAGEKKKAEAAKKEGEKSGDKKKEGEAKKDGEKKASGSGEKKESKGEKSNSVVYYDLILKGLPKGTTVDELYPLLDPYVSAQRPIKLEARPDKNDNNTIRTFAFVVLTNKGKYKTADEAVPALKKAKLTLGGTNVIVDRVREKFEK